MLISSPELLGSQGELIVYPCSGAHPAASVRLSIIRPSTISKISSWPIKAKFYMKHVYIGGINVYIHNPCHITKMAAMPICGKKNLQKPSPPELIYRFQ